MAASSSNYEKAITLTSSDGLNYKIEDDVAVQMPLIHECFKDWSDYTRKRKFVAMTIPGVIIEKVINYCRKHVENPNSNNPNYIKEIKDWDMEYINNIDNRTFIQLTNAAYFFQIQSLIDLISQSVADFLKDKSVEEIREMFKIQNVCIPELEERVRSEYPWAFDN